MARDADIPEARATGPDGAADLHTADPLDGRSFAAACALPSAAGSQPVAAAVLRRHRRQHR
ncbi:hypothetical protein ABZ479_04790 [Streptomyces sp. NPDC005722]